MNTNNINQNNVAPSISQDSLIKNLSCPVTLAIFHNPITTMSSCGHTFESEALSKAINVKPQCPLCRRSLQGFNSFNTNVVIKTLVREGIKNSALLEKYYYSHRTITELLAKDIELLLKLIHSSHPDYREIKVIASEDSKKQEEKASNHVKILLLLVGEGNDRRIFYNSATISHCTTNDLNRIRNANGYSVAFWLAITPEGRQILNANNGELLAKVSNTTLNTLVTDDGPYKGMSLAHLLLANCPTLVTADLVARISNETLNAPVTDDGPYKGMSLAYILLAKYPTLVTADLLATRITKETLNAQVTGDGPYKGISVAYILLAKYPTLVTADLVARISNETLNTLVTDDGPYKGMSLANLLLASCPTLVTADLLSRITNVVKNNNSSNSSSYEEKKQSGKRSYFIGDQLNGSTNSSEGAEKKLPGKRTRFFVSDQSDIYLNVSSSYSSSSSSTSSYSSASASLSS